MIILNILPAVSAKATACNVTTTVVHLETGPNFGGRISLEGAAEDAKAGPEEDSDQLEDCSYEGDPSSGQTSVVFTIDHARCAGVRMNTTAMRAFVVVQETLPILTHSTRRFLVVCNFKPSTFTVRAG